jgi:hypothetical protein
LPSKNKTDLEAYLCHSLSERDDLPSGLAASEPGPVERYVPPYPRARRPYVIGCVVLLFNLLLFGVAGLVIYLKTNPDQADLREGLASEPGAIQKGDLRMRIFLVAA